MPISIKFGGQSLDLLADKLEKAGLTASDIRYGLERQKTRILDRTQRGVDMNGSAFKPYSTDGPYYYYPNRGATPSQRRASAGRLGKKIGAGKRTRVGLKFASYAAFKSALGRGTVDLTGVSAPHMLQSMVIRSSGLLGGTIGIYGPEADRATGHNTGYGNLPQREFFGWGRNDEAIMLKDMETILTARLDQIL